MTRNPFTKAAARHDALADLGPRSQPRAASPAVEPELAASAPAPVTSAVRTAEPQFAAFEPAPVPVAPAEPVGMKPLVQAAEAQPGQLTRKQRLLKVLEPICLIIPPASMFPMAFFHVPAFGPVSAIVVILAMIPFFLDFEAANLRARDLMPIVVMAALGVAGRLIFAPIPAIKPVTAIVIVTAMSFGRQTGFITGALIALVSNIFFGQGPWTPWQMYTWGLVGYLSGIFFDKGWIKNNWFILVYGFAASYFYGAILDTWTFVGFVQPWTLATAAVTYGGGAIYNLGHAIGTVLFLIPIAKTWPIKFERVKRKYGIGGWTRETTNAAPMAASAREAHR